YAIMTGAMRAPLTLASLVTVALAIACGSQPAPGPAAAGGGKHVDPATAGTITGHVMFTGTPPAPEPLKIAADPACLETSGPSPKNDAVLINDGSLQNVFVYVKEGLDPSYTFDVPKEALK